MNLRHDTLSASAAVYRKANVGSAYVQGAELQAEWHVGSGFEWFGHLTSTYGQQTSLDQPMRRISPVNGLVGVRWKQPRGPWIEAGLRFAAAQRRLSSGDRDDHRIPLGGTPGC